MNIPQELNDLSKHDLICLILSQNEIIEKLKLQNSKLEKRLLAYENAHTPPSLKGGFRFRYPKRENSNHVIGAPKGHQGTTRKTPEPTESKTLSLDFCPDCHHHLGKPTRVVRRVIEEVPNPQPLRVIEFFVNHYNCPYCKKEIFAKDSELPSEGRLGNNLQAEITHLKFVDRLPLRKICQTLNRKYPNLNLTAATILDVLRRVSNKLEPDYNAIKQKIKESDYSNADETGAKLDGKRHWLWVFMSFTHVLFCISKKRESKIIKNVLGEDYQGILTCDGLKGYPKVVKKIQRCWAHLLREAKFLAQKHKGQAELLYNVLCQIFQKIKSVTINMNQEEKMVVYDFCTTELKSWIKTCKAYTELKKLINTIENAFEQWFICVLYPEVKPTNNRAERELREFVVQRKISGSFRSQKGIEITEIIMSILATWKLQGLNTYTLLRQTLSS